jgi:hypothetical protein
MDDIDLTIKKELESLRKIKTYEELVIENENLKEENRKLFKDKCNLKIVLKEAVKLIHSGYRPAHCIGCGHDHDEEHKADCVLSL